MAKVNTPAVQKLSFKSSDFTAGGLMADGRYLFKECDVVEWDYDGKQGGAKTIAFRVKYSPIEVDSKGNIKVHDEEKVQYWSAGEPGKINPSPDGTGFMAGTSTGLSNQSNFFIFIQNIEAAGGGALEFDNDVSIFNDMAVEIGNIPAPKREIQQSNLVAAGQPQQEPRNRTIPVVKVIGKMPGETKWNMTGVPSTVAKPAAAAARPAAAASKPNGKVAEASSDNLDEVLKEAIGKVMGGDPEMDRTQLRMSVFKTITADGMKSEEKKKVLELFNSDESLTPILESLDIPMKIDGNNITLA